MNQFYNAYQRHQRDRYRHLHLVPRRPTLRDKIVDVGGWIVAWGVAYMILALIGIVLTLPLWVVCLWIWRGVS